MFCSFYLILYIIWFHFSLSLSPFYYFDYYEHQYFTFVLFHMFSFIKNALFGSYSWMSHRTFIESSAVTTAFWLDQYGGRFASIFRRCPPSMFGGQWWQRANAKFKVLALARAVSPFCHPSLTSISKCPWCLSLLNVFKALSSCLSKRLGVSQAKASELVPCSLLPHWNSMRFFATVSLYD